MYAAQVPRNVTVQEIKLSQGTLTICNLLYSTAIPAEWVTKIITYLLKI